MSKMAAITSEDRSPTRSDSGWTFVNSPPSSNSSFDGEALSMAPESSAETSKQAEPNVRTINSEENQSSLHRLSGSESIQDDLSEIDLNEPNGETQHDRIEPLEDNDDEKENIQAKMLVVVGKCKHKPTQVHKSKKKQTAVAPSIRPKPTANPDSHNSEVIPRFINSQIKLVSSVNTPTQNPPSTNEAGENAPSTENASFDDQLFFILNKFFGIIMITIKFLLVAVIIFSPMILFRHEEKAEIKSDKTIYENPDSIIDLGPSSQAFVELKLMHEEITECIKRGGYQEKTDSPTTYVAFKGLVCYEQEKEWRKRFETLETKYNLDLRRVLKQARKRLTAEMLESYHPSLHFRLIVNQLEYIDYMDDRRKDRMIKSLKAKNLELARLLDQQRGDKSSNGNQEKWLTNVEVENSRLKQEIEALKANLVEKTGTVYIRQSLELEKCDRENVALKKFHHQVASEISKGLRQLNVQTIDPAAILDGQESLNSQLALTRGYLIRYGEEVNNLILKNEALKEELKENRLSTIAANSLASIDNHNLDDKMLHTETAHSEDEPLSCLRGENNSDTLTPDNCHNREFGGCNKAKSNWLMRRAKLRERLRKESVIDAIDPHIEHIIRHGKHKQLNYHHEKTSHDDRKYHINNNNHKNRKHNHNNKRHNNSPHIILDEL